MLYPQVWTVDLTDGLKSENGYANEVTANPQDNRVLRSVQIWRLASPADSEIKLGWLNECPPISWPFAFSVSRSARVMNPGEPMKDELM